MKKDIPFHWGREQESSFKDLKLALTHVPLLVFPNFNDSFVIFTGASGVGIGAVLMKTGGVGSSSVCEPCSHCGRKKNLFSYSLRDSGRGLGTSSFSRHHYGI